jgi:hypothetical protein
MSSVSSATASPTTVMGKGLAKKLAWETAVYLVVVAVSYTPTLTPVRSTTALSSPPFTQ